MNRAIGIDLGTTNSVIAYIPYTNSRTGKNSPEVIVNRQGKRTTPSLVSFGSDRSVLVGETAKNQMVINAERTISGIKRKMGDANPVLIEDEEYLPEHISSYILSALKKDAEAELGGTVKDAVITVPAYFSDVQRKATIKAGELAGFNVLRIINEPTAAALAYGQNSTEAKNILVYDLGGGTFDVSLLQTEDGIFEVKATKGNNRLGGMDFDNRLFEVVASGFYKETGIQIKQDKLAVQKLKEAVEKAKITLSGAMEASIYIPFISADETGPKHLECSITRREFENLIDDYINETLTITREVIREAGIDKEEIDTILLVGGSTRIPAVARKIEELIGVKVSEGINPDEVVGLGAAVQAGIIEGRIDDTILVDVVPLSLGIELDNGMFVPLIPRNTPVPVQEKKIFTTASDSQQDVEVHILQGERKYASQNLSLGRFQLSGIRRALRGEPRIEVSFDIDVNSIVKVGAKDLDTGKKQTVKISSKVNLSKKDIEKYMDSVHNPAPFERDDTDYIILKNEVQHLIMRLEKIEQLSSYDTMCIVKAKDNIFLKDKKELEKNVRQLQGIVERSRTARVKTGAGFREGLV